MVGRAVLTNSLEQKSASCNRDDAVPSWLVEPSRTAGSAVFSSPSSGPSGRSGIELVVKGQTDENPPVFEPRDQGLKLAALFGEEHE